MNKPYIVEVLRGQRGRYSQETTEHATLRAALRTARAGGRHDLPAVIWKQTKVGSGQFRPYIVVVEGRILRR